MPVAGLGNRNIVVNSATQSPFSWSFLCSERRTLGKGSHKYYEEVQGAKSVRELNIKAEIYNW